MHGPELRSLGSLRAESGPQHGRDDHDDAQRLRPAVPGHGRGALRPRVARLDGIVHASGLAQPDSGPLSRRGAASILVRGYRWQRYRAAWRPRASSRTSFRPGRTARRICVVVCRRHQRGRQARPDDYRLRRQCLLALLCLGRTPRAREPLRHQRRPIWGTHGPLVHDRARPQRPGARRREFRVGPSALSSGMEPASRSASTRSQFPFPPHSGHDPHRAGRTGGPDRAARRGGASPLAARRGQRHGACRSLQPRPAMARPRLFRQQPRRRTAGRRLLVLDMVARQPAGWRSRALRGAAARWEQARPCAPICPGWQHDGLRTATTRRTPGTLGAFPARPAPTMATQNTFDDSRTHPFTPAP